MPERIQHEMTQTLQRTLPANLKQYAGGNTYIPEHAKQAIMQHMERTMPAHLREYTGEFMREASIAGAQTVHPNQPQPTQHATPPPVPDRRRLDHSLGFGQQYSVDPNNPSGMANQGSLAYTTQYQPSASPDSTATPPPEPTSNPSGPNYDFIVNYNHHSPNQWLATASFKSRILIVIGGMLGLLILVWIFVAILSAGGGGSVQNFTSLAAEQTELARISATPSKRAESDATQNLASTTRLTLLSDESNFVAYLSQIGSQPSDGVLAGNRSVQTDAELSSAQASGTYDQTYTSIATVQLTKYARDLKLAFNAARNNTERTLLNQAYDNVQLLLTLAKNSS